MLRIAQAGRGAGCHEALFTLGERPEARYPSAARLAGRARLRARRSTTWSRCAELVLDETGLLPHANAGALHRDELAALRTVTASQGMMIESLRPPTSTRHRGAPDKTPSGGWPRCEAAGELAIPFTTGILVGIGETEADRIAALEAIADAHRRHGHVQEVIVQNFLPKPGTAMHRAPAVPAATSYLTAIALARLMLPAEVHVQAPPNLSDDFGALLDAGIDDWGGVSPVTADHVNPERPWPALDRLREVTEAARLHAGAAPHHLPGVRARSPTVAGRRPSVSRCWTAPTPRASAATIRARSSRADRGAGRRRRRRRRGACWSGAAPPPGTPAPTSRRQCCVPAPARATGAVRAVLDGVRAGQRAGLEESWSRCSRARGPEVGAVAEAGRRAARRQPSATPSPRWSTATSTTPTCARSGAGSAGSPRARCR